MKRSLNGCPAPAKLNLFLHVTGRREDGYHLLQTAFQLIDRADLLDFDLREDGEIRRSTLLQDIPHDRDLIVRAARLLQHATHTRFGADIAINKILPLGGGLGGGSSDAATTLIGLNHLWQTGLSRPQLMALGLQLGADVPFFLLGSNAFAEGIGEELIEIDTPERWFVIIEPGVSIPTATIFASPELTRNTKPVTLADFSGAQIGFVKNDLQTVATARFSQVAAAVKWLEQFGAARMTGSGACLFCPFDSERQAKAVAAMTPPHWTAWVAKSLQRHPMADMK